MGVCGGRGRRSCIAIVSSVLSVSISARIVESALGVVLDGVDSDGSGRNGLLLGSVREVVLLSSLDTEFCCRENYSMMLDNRKFEVLVNEPERLETPVGPSTLYGNHRGQAMKAQTWMVVLRKDGRFYYSSAYRNTRERRKE